MQILVLNGSPRPHGNTSAMVSVFVAEASERGHQLTVIPGCQMEIAACRGCEHCHTRCASQCIVPDDMQAVYPLLAQADMIVLASPIYYHSFSGQLHCAIHRFYALDKPKKLKMAAMLLRSGSDAVYDAALYIYEHSFLDYLNLENMGVFTAFGVQNQTAQTLHALHTLRSLGSFFHKWNREGI